MITNKTRKKILHRSPKWAKTTWQQAKGFMFSRPGKKALIFPFAPYRRVVLHMFFVFGPIDVLALNSHNEVIGMKEHFSPWSVWNAGVVSYIIELPDGTIAKTKTQIGDVVTIPE